jgi:integrase
VAKRRAWGSGMVVERDNGTFQIVWYENKRRQRFSGLTTRKDAERALATIRANIANGKAGLPQNSRNFPTIGEEAARWLNRREAAKHRSIKSDRYRWKLHLAPYFADLKPQEVDSAKIRKFVEEKLTGTPPEREDRLAPATVRLCIMLLSALFGDLVERSGETGATTNVVHTLPKSIRRMIKPDHDPRTTPFIEKLADVRRIHLALDEPVNVAYAIGALAGLRTGEVLALKWRHVDLANRRIHVQESIKGLLKDTDSRFVAIQDALHPILTAWSLKTGGNGLVVPPMRSDGKRCDQHTVGKYLRAALVDLKLPRVTWYQATRHTFASQFVLGGGSIEKLKEMLGHCSVVVTERYTHLRPDSFSDRDRATIAVDLRPGGEVVHMQAPASKNDRLAAEQPPASGTIA